jgi:hypothetical protein
MSSNAFRPSSVSSGFPDGFITSIILEQMSPWPEPMSNRPGQVTVSEHITISPSREHRPVGDKDRPLPPAPQARFDYEIPTLRRKPHSDPPHAAALKHNRSFSHPFPSFFSGRKSERKNSPKNDGQNEDTTDEDSSVAEGKGHSQDASRNVSRNTSVKTDQKPMTGTCITCSTLWGCGYKSPGDIFKADVGCVVHRTLAKGVLAWR